MHQPGTANRTTRKGAYQKHGDKTESGKKIQFQASTMSIREARLGMENG